MIKKIVILGVTIGVFYGCGRLLGGRRFSETTGWKITDPAGMFKAKTRYDVQKTGPGLVFIEGGSFVMGRTKEDVMHDWNNTPKRQQVHSFYMDETEVTNIAYREYLSWLKKVFPPEEAQFSKLWQSALPDTTVWRSTHAYNEVHVSNYLYHPAYNYYPVVGVNWLQANRYAAWRTDRVNERILIKRGYLSKEEAIKSYGANHFSTEIYLGNPSTYNPTAADGSGATGEGVSGSRERRNRGKRKGFVGRGDGVLLPAYRLPTEVEWEYAAAQPNRKRIYNTQKGRASPLARLRSNRIGKKGDFLANFKRRIGDYSGIAGWPNDGAATTCETRKFPPNDAGLYGMLGNVAEWVADRYEPIIYEKASDLNYYRGKTFKKVMREDGKTAVISETVTYDTLPNGKLVYHNLPGQILYEKLADSEARKGGADNTAQTEGVVREENPGEADSSQGDSPPADSRAGTLSEARSARGYGPDHAYVLRVIKGGSWRDHAYWLDPSKRRFMREDKAASWIGFRCAMDRVGKVAPSRTRRN